MGTSKKANAKAQEAAKGKIKLFVYGTLKQGLGNDYILQRSGTSKFVGFDTITGPLRMVDLGGIPAVLYDENASTPIKKIYGEVWTIDTSTLQACDILEGHPDFYRRLKLRTDALDKNVWIYLGQYQHWGNLKSVGTGCWRPTNNEKIHWTSLGVSFHV